MVQQLHTTEASMTNPTPGVNAEAVERLSPYVLDGGRDAYGQMEYDPIGDYVTFDAYEAMRERAEAAERRRREAQNRFLNATQQLIEARAEAAAAWEAGRDAMMPTVKANCRICGGSGYSGGTGGTGNVMPVMYPCYHGVHHITPPADAHTALQQVREAARVDGWKVKPLVWDDRGAVSKAAAPFFGSFRVENYGGRIWEAVWSVPGYSDQLFPGEFFSAKAAKEAVEAHYADRIRALALPAPTADGET